MTAVAAPSHARRGRMLRNHLAEVGRLRLLDLILGVLLIVEMEMPGLGVPINAVVLLAIMVLALSRRPDRYIPALEWLIPIMVLALAYLALVSVIVDQHDYALDWKRRLIRMALTVAALCLMPTGRIHLRSLILGMWGGLAANIPLWLAGLNADQYAGYLTGLLVDKNVAGLAYAVAVFAVLAVVKGRGPRVVLCSVLLAGLWLSGSRTSLAACAAGLLWALLAPHLHTILRWALGGVIYIAIQLVSEDFSRIGRFSDRVGSDLLRYRIDNASLQAVHEAGFWGKGLGEAVALINGNGWFFHNSYWTALVEGGWPWLTVLLLVTGVFVMRPFASGHPTRQEAIIQAGAVVLFVCSSRLGEVFMTVYWMIIIALALAQWSVPREEADHGRAELAWRTG